MASLRRNRTIPLSVEALEDRYNLSPVLLQDITLPSPNSTWDFSNGPFVPSPIISDLDGDGFQEVITPGGDNALYAYKYNPATGLMNPNPRRFRRFRRP